MCLCVRHCPPHSQEVNTADVEHMAKEKAHLDDMLDAVSAQKDKEEKV